MAPQWTTTKGPPLRKLAEWMAWAKSSLPVPDSPPSTTGSELLAAVRAISTAMRSGAERPWIRSKS